MPLLAFQARYFCAIEAVLCSIGYLVASQVSSDCMLSPQVVTTNMSPSIVEHLLVTQSPLLENHFSLAHTLESLFFLPHGVVIFASMFAGI